jgi:N-formylglutamate deformylase
VQAIQLEMCWRCYMQESAPYAFDTARARRVLPVLEQLLRRMLDWSPDAAG